MKRNNILGANDTGGLELVGRENHRTSTLVVWSDVAAPPLCLAETAEAVSQIVAE